MRKNSAIMAATLFLLAIGQLQADDKVHWACEKATLQPAEYVDVPEAAPRDAKFIPVAFWQHKKEPVECATVCPACEQSCAGCCKDSHHKGQLKNWLFYRIHPCCSGYACTWYPPVWTFFLDHHCNPGWDGWQPNCCCHGSDNAQQGCCSTH